MMGSSSRFATHIPLLLLLLLPLLNPPACAVVTDSIRFTSFSFNRFDQGIQYLTKKLTFTGNSTAGQGALQITPLAIEESYLINQTGAVYLSSPFLLSKLTPDGRKVVASFFTTFAITFRRINGSIKGGEGLAFLIASSDSGPPPGSYGGYMGLSNGSTDGNAANGFAAIEFDTVQQDYDIDGNHIGLDVNGVRSLCATPLAPIGINLSDGTSHTVTVEYDGSSRYISVYMSTVDSDSKPVLRSPLDISRIILGRDAFFGFSASTGLRYQRNYVTNWNMTVELLDDHPKKTSRSSLKRAVQIGLSCMAVLVVLGILGVALFLVYVNKTSKTNGTIDFRTVPGILKEFSYREIKAGSNNFHDAAKLGQGAFGVVFRATVQNTVVAVKKFSAASKKGQRDFMAELRIINGLRHRHLVKLLGWCHHREELLLVYEIMENGSLDKYILGREGRVLSWNQRYNVVVGLASAVNYLHNEYGSIVIHRDIKPSNILLDGAMEVHLGDFGLARALDKSGAQAISAGGTLAYMAPECLAANKSSKESDVYSFGTVFLEVVCGRLIGDLWEDLWTLYGAGSGRIVEAVDQKLAGQFDRGDGERILLLGLACTHPNPGERPGMQCVMRVLARSESPPAIAPSNVWPLCLAFHQHGSSGIALTGSISTASGNIVTA